MRSLYGPIVEAIGGNVGHLYVLLHSFEEIDRHLHHYSYYDQH